MAVEAINRKLGVCLMVGGSTVPITTWLNDEGQECDAAEAVMAVAGLLRCSSASHAARNSGWLSGRSGRRARVRRW